MGKKSTNQLAARALMNVLHHATEDGLPEATVVTRARLYSKSEWWCERADWALAFSRLVQSGRVKGRSDVSGVAVWSSTRHVLPVVVGRWL
jgi:hypothetical protein